MRNLLFIFATLIAIPALSLGEEFNFDPSQPESIPAPKEPVDSMSSSSSSTELIERDIDELFRRVDELERTKIDAAEAEDIAEKVFERLSIVVNKTDGGQELKTFNVPVSDGTVIKTTLSPGQTFGSLIDPVTGRVVYFGEPNVINVTSRPEPVYQYQFENFEVRQSSPAMDGTRTVNVKVGSGPVRKTCQMVGNEMVCTQVSQTSAPNVTVKQQPRRRGGLFGFRR